MEKTLKFWIYTSTSCFIKIVQKVKFSTWNRILFDFFLNHKVLPLVFFSILMKIQAEPFSGLVFSRKRNIFELTLLHSVIILELLKMWFYNLKSYFISFFYKIYVVPFVLRFLEKTNPENSSAWIFINIEKKLRYYLMIYKKKSNKMRFQELNLTFWTILIKQDVVV